MIPNLPSTISEATVSTIHLRRPAKVRACTVMILPRVDQFSLVTYKFVTYLISSVSDLINLVLISSVSDKFSNNTFVV
jgi:hypothetical protein